MARERVEEKERLHVYVLVENKRALKELAKKTRINSSMLIDEAIEDLIAKYNGK